MILNMFKITGDTKEPEKSLKNIDFSSFIYSAILFFSDINLNLQLTKPEGPKLK